MAHRSAQSCRVGIAHRFLAFNWWAVPALPLLLLLLAGCRRNDTRQVITIWHQMRPAERELLEDEIGRFQAVHPGVRVRALYKETEELRSAFQAAALAGGGPELVYGPSDPLDTFQTMGILQDISPWFPDELRGDFVDGALTYLPARADPSRRELVQIGDRFGNHLALVYNRRFISQPPKTTDELVELAVKNTLDENHDGRKERYGLVWNFTEPFFAVPFLTGYGGWVFAEPQEGRPVPALDTPQAVEAYRFIKALRDKHGVVPANCDYELADALFKTGRAAMIINGDWSWADYLNDPEIDAAVAVLPVVSETGLPMRPMVAPKGYSLNVNTSPELAAEAMAFVRHMVSDDVQRRIVNRLRMLPARRSIEKRPPDARGDGAARRLGWDEAILPGAARRRDDPRGRRGRHAAKCAAQDRADSPRVAARRLAAGAPRLGRPLARRLGHLAAR
jgi:arabinogalactan oligomer/maltooligosaccharide transport system permease protein